MFASSAADSALPSKKNAAGANRIHVTSSTFLSDWYSESTWAPRLWAFETKALDSDANSLQCDFKS